jgi:hypothetical protein
MGFLVKIRGKTGGRIMEIQKERRMISWHGGIIGFFMQLYLDQSPIPQSCLRRERERERHVDYYLFNFALQIY